MSVIINDFEVVVEGGETAAGAPAPASESREQPALTPMDIRDILLRQSERRLRVQAD